MKKVTPEKKLSKLEQHTATIAGEFTHRHSVVIQSRQRVLQFEGEEIDKMLARVESTRVALRERRALIDAALKGLAQVIEKR